jgi:RimJ/RimL family protein N-acetyltransferase
MSDIHKSNSLTIDVMDRDDADSVSLLFTQIVEALPYYNATAKSSEIKKYSAELLRCSVLDEPESVLVAKRDGELAGFCISENDDGLIWLAWFAVHPSFRKQGTGLALLTRLEDHARNQKSHKIWCDCRTENKASQLALSKQGYTQLCIVRNHWYGQDFILWEKLVA